MPYIATIQGKDVRVKVEEQAPGRFLVHLDDRVVHVDALEPQPNLWSLLIEHRSFEVDVDAVPESDTFQVHIEGDPYEVELLEERKKKLAMKMAKGAKGRQDLKSPMAGNVRQILVKPGDHVAAGQALLILEAMKMQNEITSPIEGVVASVTAKEGVAVAANAPLCVVEPHPVVGA